ncbi:MAG: pectinesterase family protein [Phycisphaerales bacterium]
MTVDATGSGDYITIQSAIDAVPNASTILVAPGTYNETIDLGTKNLVISGIGKDISKTIIDGSGLDSSVVRISGEQDSSTMLQMLTIANGVAGSRLPGNANILAGGGILVIDSNPRIEFCRFTGNRSGFGGGAYLLRSESTIADCLFDDNFASADGGGLFVFRGATRICRNNFADNRAVNHGGAAKFVLGESYVHDCAMNANVANQGGGIYWFANSRTKPLLVDDSSITFNHANKMGGGIKSRFGSPPIALRGVTVCDNTPDEINGPFIDLGGNALCICPGDLSGDGMVGGADLGVLLALWGVCNSSDCSADLNGDGAINGADLGLLLGLWGPCR